MRNLPGNLATRVVAIALAAALSTSCVAHRYRTVTLPGAPPAAGDTARDVRVGDFIRAELTSGRRVTFSVRLVTPDALLGDHGVGVVRADIVRLEREVVDGRATLLLNLPILVAFVLVIGFMPFIPPAP